MIRGILAAGIIFLFSASASANYVGSEVQYFNPTPDNMDFFTVHSSRTLPKGTFKATLFFDHAENIHYSPTFENKVTQAQLGFGLGLTDRMSFSIVGSGILNYDEEVGGAYTSDDLTHLRAGVKYRFCECDKGGFAVVANVGFGLMDPDYFVGDDNDFGLSVTFVYDRMLSDTVRFGANLGYRYRNSEDTRGAAPSATYGAFTTSRDGSDVLASLGLNFLLNDKWTATSEVYMTLPTDQLVDFTVDNNTYDQKGAEVLLGANYKLNDSMDIGFGGTVGVFSEAQNADWRVFLGLGYFFGGASEDAAFNLAGNGSAPAPVVAKPVKKEAVKIEDAPVRQAFDITAQFVSGSANLTGPAKTQLDKVGVFLRGNSDYRMIFVEGHTDSAGRDESNKVLSQRRAQSVKNYLTRAHKVSVDKIQAVGFGETAPIADNSTPAGRAKNRRVIIKIK